MTDDVDEQTKKVVEQDLITKESPVSNWISSGCTILDLSTANQLPGGFPVSRIIEIFGPPSSCKSVLGIVAIGYVQRLGGIGFYIDVESTFQSYWAQNAMKYYGVDDTNKDTFRLSSGKNAPATIEDLFDTHINDIVEMDDDREKVIVIDTLSALSTTVELSEDLDAPTYGAVKAKQISKAFRKYSPPLLTKKKITLIVLNQTRENIGVTYGPKDVTTGGKAMAFYSTLRIRLSTKTVVKKTIGNKEVPTGVWINFKVEKNKLFPPFKEGEFRIMYDYGLDDVFSNLNFLKQFQGGDKGSKSVEFNKQTKTMKAMMTFVEKEGLEDKLQKAVQKLWKEVHKPAPRKERSW